MKLENGWETSFLEVVQNSEFKKEALLVNCFVRIVKK